MMPLCSVPVQISPVERTSGKAHSSDPTGEDDGGPSDEVSGAEIFDVSESLGDSPEYWRGWEELEHPGRWIAIR